jgi:hypothetical protein
MSRSSKSLLRCLTSTIALLSLCRAIQAAPRQDDKAEAVKVAQQRVIEMQMRQIELRRAALLQLEQTRVPEVLKEITRPGKPTLKLINASRQIDYEIIDLVEPNQPVLQEKDPLVDDLVIEEPIAAQRPRRAARLSLANFDLKVFNNMQTDKARQEWLESILLERLMWNEERFKLNASQIDKLRLAGQGDIKRFLTRVARSRRAFDEARKNRQDGTRLLERTISMSLDFKNGPFNDDSLFFKALTKILNDRVGEERIPK